MYRFKPILSMLVLFVISLFVVSFPTILSAEEPATPQEALAAKAFSTMKGLPIAFEPLPTGGDTAFAVRGPGYQVALTPTVLSLHTVEAGVRKDGPLSPSEEILSQHGLNDVRKRLEERSRKEPRPQMMEVRLNGGNADARAMLLDQHPARANYFIGNDPAAWRADVPLYGKVRYGNVYPDIDLVYYGNPQQLEMDFEVRPHANPDNIRLEFPAGAHLELAPTGDLHVHSGGDAPLKLHAPITYQKINGQQVLIASAFKKLDERSVGFTVGDYDRSETLVIDPILVYSTFLGGNAYDNIFAIAVDVAGNVYVGGYTFSTNFPIANGISGTKKGTSADAFVSKISPAGDGLIYSTYLGGLGFDEVFGLAVDSSGVVTIAGDTSSADFPLMNPVQPAFGGGYDLFVARINAAGSALSYSTYLGGSSLDVGIGINPHIAMLHVDSSGAAYIAAATLSSNFPTTTPLQATFGGAIDAVVAKLNPTGSTLVFSTYLGGSNLDLATAITTDASGNVYVTGMTNSTNFPIQAAYDGTYGGGSCGGEPCLDAFIAKLNAAGTSLVYSTYLGGSLDDAAESIDVDSAGNVYVAGTTFSTDFPTATPLQSAKGASSDAFVTKLNPAGSALVYSTYLGAGGGDQATRIRVDAAGRAVLTGLTGSTAFPMAGATQGTRGGNFDAFVSVLNSAGTGLDFSTFLGGLNADSGTDIALSSTGNIYVAGWTESANFPAANALQATFGGGTCTASGTSFPCDDGFVVKYGNIGVAPVITSISPTTGTVGGAAFTLTVNGSGFNANSLIRVGALSRPTTFVGSGQLTAAMPASDLASPGTLQISVFNGAPDNLASNVVPFTVQAGQNAPSISQGGIVNNASFVPSPAPLAPGSIAAIFGQRLTDGSTALSSSFDSNGRLATTLAGTRVTVNGTAAPLFYATPGQLGIQVPTELAGQTSASVQVTVGSSQSTPVSFAIANTAPGIFTVSQDGRGPGAITHADGSLVNEGNPARPGEVLIIYVTGLGSLVPAVSTGVRAGASPTLAPAVVSFNGIAGIVEYSGSAPGFVGLNQINVRVPLGTLPSGSVQVVVRIGGQESNTATIAVQ